MQELGGYSSDSFDLIKRAFADLPFDPYDSSVKSENLVKKYDPVAFLSNQRDWLRFWSAELGFNQQVDIGRDYWISKTNNFELIELLKACNSHRKRGAFQYLVSPVDRFKIEVLDVGCPNFTQSVDDIRSRPRKFSKLHNEISGDSYFRWLVAAFSQLVIQTSGIVADRFKVTAHMMRTYALDSGGEPAPEGIHQDGSPYIVSGLVVERENIEGGVSKIYYDHKGQSSLAISTTLEVGEGIFQADTVNGYFHSISTIHRKDKAKEGYRSIIGFDIDYN